MTFPYTKYSSTSSTDKYVLKYKHQEQVLYLTPTLALTNEELVEREALTSTPVHNIAAEEEVGMVSAAQKKAPGATMVFHASKIKSVRNRSVGYLSGLPAAEQKKRIALAVAGGRSTKQEAILQGQALKAEVIMV